MQLTLQYKKKMYRLDLHLFYLARQLFHIPFQLAFDLHLNKYTLPCSFKELYSKEWIFPEAHK